MCSSDDCQFLVCRTVVIVVVIFSIPDACVDKFYRCVRCRRHCCFGQMSRNTEIYIYNNVKHALHLVLLNVKYSRISLNNLQENEEDDGKGGIELQTH